MKPEDEFTERYQAAKAQTEAVKKDMRELYAFLFNGREREWDEYTTPKHQEPEEIFDTTAAEANIDFAGDLFMYATPDTKPWVEFEITNSVAEESEDEALELAQQREVHIADTIKSSNYYEVGLQIFQEAGIGVLAANIIRPHSSKAIEFEPVPISQLHFTVGATGPEDRFREKMCFNRDIKRLFPDFTPSAKLKKQLEKPGTVKVCWGYWRDYSDPGNPQWIHTAKVAEEWAAKGEILGREGSCPLQIGRFNPIPSLPHGRGPARVMLEEIRTINALRQMVLDKMDQVVDPAFVYTRDAVLDLSGGIEAGIGYPALNAENAVAPINADGNLDYALFSLEDLEARIRRGFFRKPDQQGKTPPSATQFLGEDRATIRRLGRPGSSVFNEFVRGMLTRVEFLEVQANRLDAFLMIEDNQILRLNPVSPMHRAQAEEEVIQAQGILEMSFNLLGPQEGPITIDGVGTINNIKSKLGDALVVIRTPEEAAALRQQAQGSLPDEAPPA